MRLTSRAEAMLDWMMARPGGRLTDCGKELGMSLQYFSLIVRSEVSMAK